MKPPAWWPAWAGQPCVVLASGPSAVRIGIEQARGRARLIAINRSVELAPWADALYAADHAWWKANDGVPGFSGLKLSADYRASREGWGVEAVSVRRGDDRLLFDEPGVVGRGGGASGFQAFNLACQFGCDPVILAGFDLNDGLHWHPQHDRKLGNPNMPLIRRWKFCLDSAAKVAAGRGITVLNVSPGSALETYRKVTLAEALDVGRQEGPACRLSA